MQFKMLKEKTNLLKILLAIFILVFTINIGIITASKNSVKQKEDAASEVKRPANISLVIIKDSLCTDCADIRPLANLIKGTNVKITKEETFEAASPEAKDLIRELEIKKLPVFIIKGELNKNADVAKLLSQIGEVKNDTFKFTYFIAPYLDLASGSVKGKVTVDFISDKTCTECFDINLFKQILMNNLGMISPNIVSLDKSDKAAQDLIRRYKIGSVPTLVIAGEVSEYSNLTGPWLTIGAFEKDGSYVLRNIKGVSPDLVYRDLGTGKIIKPEAPKTPAGK
jgi:hypothetical protein